MYTAKQTVDQRISFKPMSREQFDKLKAHFEKLYPGDYSRVQYSKNSYYRFYQERLSYESFQAEHANYMSYSYTKAAESIKSTNEISFEEFDFEDEFVLPAKWCVKRDTREKSLILSEWANKVSNTDRHEGYSDKNFIHSENVCSYSSSPRSDGKQKGFTEITFEQFKKYILKMDKKIIGYICPMELYSQNGLGLKQGDILIQKQNVNHWYVKSSNDTFTLPFELVKTWEPVYESKFKAGEWVVFEAEKVRKAWGNLYTEVWNKNHVLKIIEVFGDNLVFDIGSNDSKCFRHATKEEIEIAQTKTVRMGGENGFDLVIKGNKVFHKTDDITLYVEDIYETYGILLDPKTSSKGTSYDFHPKDLIIGKTGCQNKETKLTEWLALYEMIKK